MVLHFCLVRPHVMANPNEWSWMMGFPKGGVASEIQVHLSNHWHAGHGRVNIRPSPSALDCRG